MTKKCKCRLCEPELVEDCMEPNFCQSCEVVFVKCDKCGASYSNKLAECPDCQPKQK